MRGAIGAYLRKFQSSTRAGACLTLSVILSALTTLLGLLAMVPDGMATSFMAAIDLGGLIVLVGSKAERRQCRGKPGKAGGRAR
ncbi:hypothetical protein BS47DRAFT_1400262 [Hydnum rufescens UP504]|uniref:Uncharacterized protein n=1 Tax=Hydnum rufescens UP504 TaxID=1448309 RepID=A0A9P6AGT7_9AGAM|nr:hypothetical protein BS47DRAFT_1400262 [Hydnum rufescens UP504]